MIIKTNSQLQYLWRTFNTGQQFAFTGVYGPCNRKLRRTLWKELASINGIILQPWAVGGDFNVIRFAEEKPGAARNTKSIRELSNTINELELKDLPLHGGDFTCFKAGQVSYFREVG